MLYPWLEWQRTSLTAWLETARAASAASPLAQLLHPPGELLARTMAAGAISERPLEIVVRLDAPFPVRSEVIAATPFVRLVRLRRPGPQRRRFVILAPNSGYATDVLLADDIGDAEARNSLTSDANSCGYWNRNPWLASG